MDTNNNSRTGFLLYKKLFALLLPSVMCSAALTLNEFADSILMSNLLGSRALAVINYCYCIACIYAAVAYVCGYGGSIAYAKLAGVKKEKEAQAVYYKSLTLAFLISIAILIFGLVFVKNIAEFICKDMALLADLEIYLIPLFIAAPFFIVVNVICLFLPLFGKANLSMILMVAANVINICMDYGYVTFFHMDIRAASSATLTGYVCAMILLVLFALSGKLQNVFKPVLLKNLKEACEILVTGLPFGLAQLCFSAANVYVNYLAIKLGGEAALIAIALETQLMSIVSIVQCGIRETVSSFSALLHSQQDNIGIRIVMRTCIIVMTVFSVLFAIFIEIEPQVFVAAFNITDPDTAALSIIAVRILVLTHVIRSITMLFRNYLSAIGFNFYSLIISCIDGFFGVLIITCLLTPFIGLYGLWLSYPVSAAILLLGVLIINKMITVRHPQYHGLLLLKDSDSLAQMNLTILSEDDVVSSISYKVQQFCLKHHVPDYQAMVSGLLTEEMSIFESERNHKSLLLDIKLDIYSDRVKIDFRSLGVPANPLLSKDTDYDENIELLQKSPSQLLYDYSLGINSVTVIVKFDGFEHKEGTAY